MAIGVVVAGHGVRGLARVKPYNPESSIFEGCESLWLKRRADTDATRFVVTRSSPHKRVFLVSLEGIESLNALEPWIKSEVYCEAALLPKPQEGEVYHFEAVGLTVQTTSGEVVGVVRDVLALPGHDAWVLEASDARGRREVLIPVVGEIVKEVDLRQGIAIIDPPQGLLEN